MWCYWEVVGRVPYFHQGVRARVAEGDIRHNGTRQEKPKVSGRVAVWLRRCSLP